MLQYIDLKKAMIKFFTKKYILFIILTAVLILTLKLFFTYNVIFYNNFNKLIFEDTNFQGIECINNKIILTEDSASVFELKNNNLELLGVLNRPNEEFYNNINFLAHLNSIAKYRNNDYFAVGLIATRAPNLVLFNYTNFINKRSISNIDIINISVKDEFKSLHIEEFYFNNKDYLIMAGKKKYDSVIDFFDYENDNLICSTRAFNEIQNIFWNKEKNIIISSGNVLHYWGGILHKYSINKNLINEDCPNLKIESIDVVFTMKELQGYTVCNSNEYYMFWSNNNSYIYSKELT